MILVILTLACLFMSQCELSFLEMQEQIRNTQQLLLLYQQKLQVLSSIYNQTFPHHPYNYYPSNISLGPAPQQKKFNHNLVLLKKINYSSVYMPPNYIIASDHIISIDNHKQAAEFMGELLIIQPKKLTTLVGGKVSVSEFIQQNDSLRTEQYFLGLSAQKLNSIWHRNLNIKNGEDLLIQWHNNIILFRGKEINSIQLPNDESIISIYSLNQYKIIFVSTHRVGIINSRSLQIGLYQTAKNISRFKNSSKSAEICGSYEQDGLITVLLSTGEIAKYYNEKVGSIQILESLQRIELSFSSIYIQYIHPFLFIVEKTHNLLSIYNTNNGRYSLSIQIILPHKNIGKDYLALYKYHQSYRLFYSEDAQTNIYEVLIPNQDEKTTTNSHFFKILGVVAVVAGLIYFRWSKKENKDGQLIKKLQLSKRMGKVQKTDRSQLEKGGFSNEQIEQFLHRKVNSQKQKYN